MDKYVVIDTDSVFCLHREIKHSSIQHEMKKTEFTQERQKATEKQFN